MSVFSDIQQIKPTCEKSNLFPATIKWIRHHTIAKFGPVREVEKSLVFEVAFDAVNHSTRHKSGVALPFPRINRIRWDKPAQEADILENLYKLISNPPQKT